MIGLLFALFAGYKYVTKSKVVDIGPIEISQDKTHQLDWSPYLGVGMMLVGGLFVLLGTKTKS
ncbi:MAG: hypothetical protein IPI18_08935 [Saprospiraceae bacterium]|nr:hypothetical protein [Saprospiraceae bacterium]